MARDESTGGREPADPVCRLFIVDSRHTKGHGPLKPATTQPRND